jgi:H/ACA ribonucleoprotein complex subunit 1
MGTFIHAVEGEMVCSSINPKIPYFNAPIYLQNKTSIGKVDEILGPINEVYFTVKMSEGMIANSFTPGDKVYIAGDKLLPLDRFLPKPKPKPGEKSKSIFIVNQVFVSRFLTVVKRGAGRGRGGGDRGRGRGGGDRGRGGRGGGRGFGGGDRGRGGGRGFSGGRGGGFRGASRGGFRSRGRG